jgi:hypothetical protein
MEITIKAIKQSLNSKNYLAALALTLTIPDVYGHVEFPKEKCVRKRYTNWYNKYFNSEYNGSYPQSNPNNLPIPPCFTADDCYQLRCAVLHAGNTDMDANKVNFNRFKLYRDINIDSGVSYKTGKPQTVQSYIYLSITRFCNVMCDVAEKYYNSHKTDFSNYHITIQ